MRRCSTGAGMPQARGPTSRARSSPSRSWPWPAGSSPRACSPATASRCSPAPATSGRSLDYAILAAGAVTVPIYETSSAEQISWILSDSGAVAALVESGKHAELVESVRAGCPDVRHVWQIEPPPGGRGAVDELVGARRGHPGRRGARPQRRRARRRPRHPDLHLGHHRPPQGLRADPPQPRQRGQGGRQHDPRAALRPGLGAAVPAARAHLRQGHPVRRPLHPHRGRRTPPTSSSCCPTSPTSARRFCSPSPASSRRSTTGPVSAPTTTARAASSTPPPRLRSSGAGRRTPAAQGWRCACGTRCSTGWSTASYAPPSAGTWWPPCPAPDRSASGSGTSSAVSAFRFSRATASPRHPPASRSTRSAPSASAPSGGRCPATPSGSLMTARSWSKARSSSAGTGRTRRPRRTRSRTAGSAPAMSANSTTPAS